MNKKNNNRIISILIGPALYFILKYALVGTFTPEAASAIGTSAWMIAWWVSGPVGLGATAIIPVAVNAIFPFVPMETIITQYASGTIILLFGACLLTLPWVTTGLDRRLALTALRLVGPNVKSQIIVWFLISVVFSALLPNTVVVTLLAPVAVAMIRFFGVEDLGKCDFAGPILLAICYGAIIGALMIVGMMLTPMETKRLEGTKDYFAEQYASLGKMKKGEIIVALLFAVGVILSFTRPMYAAILPGLEPGYALVALGLLGFVLTDEKKNPILTWQYVEKNVMWNMLFLVAGGNILGGMLQNSGAASTLADLIVGMGLNPTPYVFAVCMAFTASYFLPVGVRAIPIGYGLPVNVCMKRGFVMVVINAIAIPVVTFLLLSVWPYYGQLVGLTPGM